LTENKCSQCGCIATKLIEDKGKLYCGYCNRVRLMRLTTTSLEKKLTMMFPKNIQRRKKGERIPQKKKTR